MQDPAKNAYAPAGERLSLFTKSIYGTGDLTVNTVLASLSLVYALFFLTEYGGLRPALAGMVPLVGRVVDAFTDPMMGRISDLTRWKAGRRRPYFLIGAIPFGASFALLWSQPPVGWFDAVSLDPQWVRFAYYAVAYVLLSLAMTVLSVPYLALLPEMALDYDARTSLNTFRNAGSVLGIFAAIALRPTANALGGGAEGFALAGVVFGVGLALPWFFIYRATWERTDFRTRTVHVSMLDAARTLARHRAFRQLVGFYLPGRVAMDLVGAMLILYFAHYLGRPDDFEIMMLLFLTAVVAALPFWLRVSKRHEKSGIFIVGCLWWMAGSLLILTVQPDWPRWVIFAFAPVVGFGYAVVDLMPWAMIGEVVDEDDVESSERREGLYNGAFTFLRKLGGAVAVAGAGIILDLAGLKSNGDVTPEGVTAVRWLTGLGPALFLAISVWVARSYPLTREAHRGILSQLDERARARAGAPPVPPS